MPILIHFCWELRIYLKTDASGFALGAIISQLKDREWHPMAFQLRKITPIEQCYITHDQELLVIVTAIKHWRYYYMGSNYPIKVLIDHNNLEYFMTIKVLSGQQARQAEALLQYNFKIMYCPGKTNPANRLLRYLDYKTGRIQDSIGEIIPILQNLLRKKEESFPRTIEFYSRAEVLAMQLRSTIIMELQDIVTDQVID